MVGSAPGLLFCRLTACAVDPHPCALRRAWPARPGLCRYEGCVVVFLQATGIPCQFCGRSYSQQEQKFGDSVLGGH